MSINGFCLTGIGRLHVLFFCLCDTAAGNCASPFYFLSKTSSDERDFFAGGEMDK